MRYKNIKTGAVIDSPCPISGPDWAPVREAVEEAQEVENVVEVVEETEDDDNVVTLSEMTVVQLKEFASKHGIDLGNATKKADIIDAIALSDAVEIE
ncbi:MAG: hypothetical protein GX218_09470 [Clostridiaceae bacterium]|jgi:hypothetical protein|nr:hypothetical protein [Clostridiaceae bacterium]